MKNVPYAYAFGSLMYIMIFTRLCIAHVVGIVISFLFNPDKDHWQVV